MEKLNLNLPIIDEKGEPVQFKISEGKFEERTYAQVLGGTLLQSTSTADSDILKYFTWAMELGKNGFIEIDKADAKTIKVFVTGNPEIFIIVKAPIIQAIDALKFK